MKFGRAPATQRMRSGSFTLVRTFSLARRVVRARSQSLGLVGPSYTIGVLYSSLKEWMAGVSFGNRIAT
jgi:hypothetical protein